MSLKRKQLSQVRGSIACSPLSTSKNEYSCLSNKELIDLAQLWNKRHPDLKITTMIPREIWKRFKYIFSKTCTNERCWLKSEMFKGGIGYDLLNDLETAYAPEAPEEWQTNPNTWLTSIDIDSVMSQYEEKYHCFRFIGPSPIDFDKKLTQTECVWNALCNFNINKQGIKNKIGIIFNTDPHNKPGEHWVSLFIDITREHIVYFDSAGSDIPTEIHRLVEKIQKQTKHKYKFIKNFPIQHQKKNTECGMYSLYFIIQMLKYGSYEPFISNKRITDADMERMRKKYFNTD